MTLLPNYWSYVLMEASIECIRDIRRFKKTDFNQRREKWVFDFNIFLWSNVAHCFHHNHFISNINVSLLHTCIFIISGRTRLIKLNNCQLFWKAWFSFVSFCNKTSSSLSLYKYSFLTLFHQDNVLMHTYHHGKNSMNWAWN